MSKKQKTRLAKIRAAALAWRLAIERQIAAIEMMEN